MTTAVERKILGAFLLALAMLVGIGVIGVYNSAQATQYVNAVSIHREALTALHSMQTALLAAEAGQRGFLLTGHGEFLEPYEGQEQEARSIVRRLRSQAVHDGADQAMLDTLDGLLDRRFALMRHSIELQRSGDAAGARAAVASGEGRRTQAEIRAQLAVMASRADAALAQAELGAEQSTRRLTLVVTAGSALALLIAGVAVVRAVRDVRTLQQAGIELALARDRAESADRVKSSFLASMSHELRTPLNSIIGFTGLLLQGLPGPLNEEQRKQLGMVRTSAQHLLALINDVLDISKIEAGELRIANAAFDVRAVIERAVASVRGRAQAKGLEIGVQVADGVGPMTGDARRVEQILLNLLSNALKFTDAGRITLSAALLPAEPTVRPMVRIAVSDTGRGIRPDDLPRLFRPFEQIDGGLARDHEGTGLGLSISQRLAGLLGGAITVDSRWQQGSVFTLTLPQYLESPT